MRKSREYNGAYKVSQGLLDRFGPKRIIDTPISENGFAGMGVGAAMVGLRPIVEFMTFSFSFVAFDQVVNNAPNMLTMSGGQFNIPITFRGPNGPAHQLGATHSHATECLYANVPGLKICTPATPRDAKGLLKTAIRDNNPVLVLEVELLYSSKGMVEDGGCRAADPARRSGSESARARDVTIICYAQTVPLALAAAETLENEEEISAEVLDLRSIKPLDLEAILKSVSKTHRVVIVEQDRPFCGVGAEVCLSDPEGNFRWARCADLARSAGGCADAVQRAARESGSAERREVDRRSEESLLRLTTNRHA